jgi:hypothetical protein
MVMKKNRLGILALILLSSLSQAEKNSVEKTAILIDPTENTVQIKRRNVANFSIFSDGAYVCVEVNQKTKCQIEHATWENITPGFDNHRYANPEDAVEASKQQTEYLKSMLEYARKHNEMISGGRIPGPKMLIRISGLKGKENVELVAAPKGFNAELFTGPDPTLNLTQLQAKLEEAQGNLKKCLDESKVAPEKSRTGAH